MVMTLSSPGHIAEQRSVRWLPWAAVAGVLVVGQLVWSATDGFPTSWDIGLSEPINRFQSWVAQNRATNFFIADVLRPIGEGVQWGYNRLLDVLLSMPWFWLPLTVFVVIIRSGGWISVRSRPMYSKARNAPHTSNTAVPVVNRIENRSLR